MMESKTPMIDGPRRCAHGYSLDEICPECETGRSDDWPADRPRRGSITYTFPHPKEVVRVCQVSGFSADDRLAILIVRSNTEGHGAIFKVPVEFLPTGTVAGKHVLLTVALAG